MSRRRAIALGAVAAAGMAAGAYAGTVTGAVSVDLGVGRRSRPLGPLEVGVAAPREVVFDVIASPYSNRAPRAVRAKVRVLERADDMVLAAHRTATAAGLTATTVETVRFVRPARVDFRLVRGPVPYVSESLVLEQTGDETTVRYTGELATDLWAAGGLWGDLVARRWQEAVCESLDAVRVEAERRGRRLR